MTGKPVPPVLQFIRTIGPAAQDADATDGQLLARFLGRRDEAAFAALFRRHGPMVWGVCRRVLPDAATAEDAFQATFLVFLRRAGSIGRPELLANWLYGVACRTATRARALRARLHSREEQRPVEVAVTDADADGIDLRPLLDEELGRLPHKYRAPLVLCYLEGKTYAEAARALGWAEGTVSGRLARARDLLRGRLLRRGLALSAVSLAALLARPALAAPAGVGMPALDLTLLTAGTVSPHAIALTKGVLQAMFVSKLKVAGAALLAVALVGTGAGVASHRLLAGEGAASSAPAAAPAPLPAAPAEKEKVADKEKPADKEEAAPIATSPDGKTKATADDKAVLLVDAATGKILSKMVGHTEKVTALAFSPDGKTLASGSADMSVRMWDVASGKELRKLLGKDTITRLTFSKDGKTLTAREGKRGKRAWDVATGKAADVLEDGGP